MTALGSVLIVEDDMALRLSLRDTLEAVGFCPSEASCGEEAFLALQQCKCETVLLDVNMPGIGGMETCRRIRQTHPLLPILVLTVRDEEKDKVEALESVGIHVVERISAEVEPLESFERYVQVKQEKMGHIIDRVFPELG